MSQTGLRMKCWNYDENIQLQRQKRQGNWASMLLSTIEARHSGHVWNSGISHSLLCLDCFLNGNRNKNSIGMKTKSYPLSLPFPSYFHSYSHIRKSDSMIGIKNSELKKIEEHVSCFPSFINDGTNWCMRYFILSVVISQ